MQRNTLFNALRAFKYLSTEYKVTKTEYVVLLHLHLIEVPTLKDLVQATQLHEQSIKDYLTKFEELNVSYRLTNTNMNKSIFQLTSKGRFILNHIESYFNRLESQL
jgi:DNA-binding MarR family transcriptional regulator